MRLVYVKGLRGPTAQKWPDDMPVNNYTPVALITHVLRPCDQDLPIKELEKKYPVEFTVTS